MSIARVVGRGASSMPTGHRRMIRMMAPAVALVALVALLHAASAASAHNIGHHHHHASPLGAGQKLRPPALLRLRTGATTRRPDCRFAGTPSSSLLTRLRERGGAAKDSLADGSRRNQAAWMAQGRAHAAGAAVLRTRTSHAQWFIAWSLITSGIVAIARRGWLSSARQ